jgi:hypothetical protein
MGAKDASKYRVYLNGKVGQDGPLRTLRALNASLPKRFPKVNSVNVNGPYYETPPSGDPYLVVSIRGDIDNRHVEGEITNIVNGQGISPFIRKTA